MFPVQKVRALEKSLKTKKMKESFFAPMRKISRSEASEEGFKMDENTFEGATAGWATSLQETRHIGKTMGTTNRHSPRCCDISKPPHSQLCSIVLIYS
jgi:hypothetical protein